MEHDIPKLLRKMLEVVPGKQEGLAKRLGLRISQPDVSRWLAGAEPQGKRRDRIIAVAHELGVLSDVRSEDVAASLDKPPVRKVKIKGYVGAGAEAHFYALADEDFEEVDATGTSDQTVAVQIKGSSLGQMFNTWLVFYDDVRSPVTDDLIGHPCVVGLSDDRILVKLIQRNGRGGFNLFSNIPGEPPIENVSIEWAAKVTDMKPR